MMFNVLSQCTNCITLKNDQQKTIPSKE